MIVTASKIPVPLPIAPGVIGWRERRESEGGSGVIGGIEEKLCGKGIEGGMRNLHTVTSV